MSSNPVVVASKPKRLNRRIQRLHSDYSEMRIDLNEFESKVLVPEMLGRSKYLLERLTDMKRVCDAKETLEYLGPALKAVIPPVPGGATDSVAADYLVGTARVIEDSYLGPLRRIASEYATVEDTAKLLRLLNEVHIICGSITQSEKTCPSAGGHPGGAWQKIRD